MSNKPVNRTAENLRLFSDDLPTFAVANSVDNPV